eukprot:5604524-Prymnesium_polylepis.1
MWLAVVPGICTTDVAIALEQVVVERGGQGQDVHLGLRCSLRWAGHVQGRFQFRRSGLQGAIQFSRRWVL